MVGTPGRLVELVRRRYLTLDKLRHFVIDECDKVLSTERMRADVQEIFTKTPLSKQVMMFSATMPEETKEIAKKFMTHRVDIFIDEGKLVLHGLTQYYVIVEEKQKLAKLVHILDTIPFNQVIVFMNKIERAKRLHALLCQKLFNPICLHSNLSQIDRIENFDRFKNNDARILIATDLVGRGIDIERVNLVINYDFPFERNTYLHRVGRAGRFATKGTNINFIRPEKDPL